MVYQYLVEIAALALPSSQLGDEITRTTEPLVRRRRVYHVDERAAHDRRLRMTSQRFHVLSF